MISKSGSLLLRRLARAKSEFGGEATARKLALVRALERARLRSAREVVLLHETLLFVRAYPDDERVLAAAERALRAFARRPDAKRFARELADSGIAGTEIHYSFFPATASFLARRFGPLLAIDWESFENQAMLARSLWLFTLPAENPIAEEECPRDWLARVRGPRESDAQFLVRRVEALDMGRPERARFAEELDLAFTLRPGRGRAGLTPSRTMARSAVGPIAYQSAPIARTRPDLARDIRLPPLSVRTLAPREGRELVTLARDCMVTHSRDLDAFMHADENDVRLFDCGGGLAFACLGVTPEERLLLESVYALVTLKNRVPIGYVLASGLFRSAEIAYNVFDTFRGAEAAHVYARALAVVHELFRADHFAVDPYQLGHENDEGLKSGAWWFYQKLAFQPRDAGARRILSRELARVRRDPRHRSDKQTLAALAAHSMHLAVGPPRDDVIGVFPIARVGRAVSRYVARRFGADRERASRECAQEVAHLLGARAWKRFPAAERSAFVRWSPLVACLEGVERWSPRSKHALVRVMRAKGARRESDFVRLFDEHAPLQRALRRLATRT